MRVFFLLSGKSFFLKGVFCFILNINRKLWNGGAIWLSNVQMMSKIDLDHQKPTSVKCK